VETKIVRIGNSHGVRLPKRALQQARLSAGQRVRVEVVEDTIVIHPEREARQGWKLAFAKAGAPDTEDLWKGVAHDKAWDK
jgi:antitoxin MazE